MIVPASVVCKGARSAGITTGSEYEKMFVAHTPPGHRGQPEDIAKAAVFLLLRALNKNSPMPERTHLLQFLEKNLYFGSP
jgi:hypothetical protein